MCLSRRLMLGKIRPSLLCVLAGLPGNGSRLSKGQRPLHRKNQSFLILHCFTGRRRRARFTSSSFAYASMSAAVVRRTDPNRVTRVPVVFIGVAFLAVPDRRRFRFFDTTRVVPTPTSTVTAVKIAVTRPNADSSMANPDTATPTPPGRHLRPTRHAPATAANPSTRIGHYWPADAGLP